MKEVEKEVEDTDAAINEKKDIDDKKDTEINAEKKDTEVKIEDETDKDKEPKKKTKKIKV